MDNNPVSVLLLTVRFCNLNNNILSVFRVAFSIQINVQEINVFVVTV